jgi:hypothetical protein
MSWQYTPYVPPLLISAVLAVFEWSLAYALELGSANLAVKTLWAKVQYIGIVIVPVGWLVFVLRYTGQDKWLTRRTVALLLIVPLITLSLVWTNEAHRLIWRVIALDTSGPSAMLELTYGPWWWLHTAYSYALLLMENELEDLRAQGVADRLLKPPRLEQLAEVVARVLNAA